MFVDEATITVKGGDGGDGIISFQHRPGQRYGGPNGGSGGDGGDVYLEADRSKSTLLSFNKNKYFEAEDGARGENQNRQGADGEDISVHLPVGTEVHLKGSKQPIADLNTHGETLLIAKGGEGGRGNRDFTNASRRAPRIREFGERGEEKKLHLELKLLADVGIIGFPNVGKSSLLSKISAQHPEVANYHFTTLDPHPGVVQLEEWEDFVAVEIPGLIEGAHKGKGLGNKFLRHLDRTRLLLHLVDLSGIEGRDPLQDWKTLRNELDRFSPSLSAKPEIVVGNKTDLISEKEIDRQQERFREENIRLNAISVATGKGLDKLVKTTFDKLQDLLITSDTQDEAESRSRKVYKFSGEEGHKVVKDGDRFIVMGQEVEKLASTLDFSTEDAVDYFYQQLQRRGIVNKLEREGAVDGSVIEIGGKEFEFVD